MVCLLCTRFLACRKHTARRDSMRKRREPPHACNQRQAKQCKKVCGRSADASNRGATPQAEAHRQATTGPIQPIEASSGRLLACRGWKRREEGGVGVAAIRCSVLFCQQTTRNNAGRPCVYASWVGVCGRQRGCIRGCRRRLGDCFGGGLLTKPVKEPSYQSAVKPGHRQRLNRVVLWDGGSK